MATLRIMAFFADLNWKPIGSVGWKRLYLEKDDREQTTRSTTGTGYAVYDPEGRYSGEKGVIDAQKVFGLLREIIDEMS